MFSITYGKMRYDDILGLVYYKIPRTIIRNISNKPRVLGR